MALRDTTEDGKDGGEGDSLSADGLSNLLPPNVTPAQMYQELRSVARAYLRRETNARTFQATSLVHEALMRLARRKGRTGPMDAKEFFSLAAVSMRRILVEHARSKGTLKRKGTRVELDPSMGIGLANGSSATLDVLAVDEALKRLEAIDERAAFLVKLRFFAGLTVAEAAEVMDVAETTAENDWRIARAWLMRWLKGE